MCVCVSLTGLSIQPHDLRVSELQLSAQQEVALQNQAARLTHHRPVLRLHWTQTFLMITYIKTRQNTLPNTLRKQ